MNDEREDTIQLIKPLIAKEAFDFTQQEAYRIAVQRQYPEEVSQYKRFANEVANAAEKYNACFIHEYNWNFLNGISTRPFIKAMMNHWFFSVLNERRDTRIEKFARYVRHRIKRKYAGNVDDISERLHELEPLVQQFAQGIDSAMLEAIKPNSDFEATFRHAYCPSLFLDEPDYLEALGYYINPIIVDRGGDGTVYGWPLLTERRLSLNSKYKLSKRTLPVPDNTLSRQLVNPRKNQEQVSKVSVHINTAGILSSADIERETAMFRSTLLKASMTNLRAKMQCSTSHESFADYYRDLYLLQKDTDSIFECASMAQSGEPIPKPADLKKLLLGMLVFQAKARSGDTIINTKHVLAERLGDHYGQGYSYDTIDRGYSAFSAQIKKFEKRL